MDPEARRARAKALKEEGNGLVREGKKAEALERYEEGLRLMGLPDGEAGRGAEAVLKDQPLESRELLSILASNAAQMCMDPSIGQLARAIERCGLAVEANPSNVKAYFRRATAAFEHADNAAEGADAVLARAQADVRRFLESEPSSPAGRQLQERLAQKRQQAMGPILKEELPQETVPAVEPDWFQQVKKRATFVCMCTSEAKGRDQANMPATLLSMAKHARDKKAISLGIAYVGYKGPEELEMFDEEWQKKYYRMLGLAERAVRTPRPRQVVVHGEVYNVWSLLEGRVRVMRVSETKQNGETVGLGWMRYCAQLLWHGEPFVYQGCRAYYRFAPNWDGVLRDNLSRAVSGAALKKPVLSWMGHWQDDEPWQWVSETVDRQDRTFEPPGVLVAHDIEHDSGWIVFRRRYFSRCFDGPIKVAFWSPHNTFSASEVLLEAPADPFTNALVFNGQVTCETVRLHAAGWDFFCPQVNLTWEAQAESRRVHDMLSGTSCLEQQPEGVREEQARRAEAVLDPGEGQVTALDEEALELPLPTACFWTAVRQDDPSPWETGRRAGCRFRRDGQRTVESFESSAGVNFTTKQRAKKAENAGFATDRDFDDSKERVEAKWKKLSEGRDEDGLAVLDSFRRGYGQE